MTNPVYQVLSPAMAEELRIARATAQGWRALFPAGARCGIHHDILSRAREDRCGSHLLRLGREPFPGSYEDGEDRQGRPIRWSFVVVQDPDGRWRPSPGELCGFELSPERVRDGVQSGRWSIVQDELSGETILASGGGLPTILLEEWSGECTMCGQCCGTRPRTGFLCDALERIEGG